MGTLCYLQTGGYAGPYKGFIHGLQMGPYFIDGEKLDLTDPNALPPASRSQCEVDLDRVMKIQSIALVSPLRILLMSGFNAAFICPLLT